MNDVQFDNESFTTRARAKGDWSDRLVASGFVKNRAQAQSLLIAIAVIGLAASLFLLFSNRAPSADPASVPQVAGPPQL